MPSWYLYKKLFKSDVRKLLPIKLVLSPSFRQNRTKIPHARASYRDIIIDIIKRGRQGLSEIFMVLLWLPFYSNLFPSGHYLI